MVGTSCENRRASQQDVVSPTQRGRYLARKTLGGFQTGGTVPKDTDNMDEWVCSIFDESGNHSEPVEEKTGTLFQMTRWANGVANYKKYQGVQLRICITRVM